MVYYKKQTGEAVLIDVRIPEEYQEGHIPGSINIPLQQMEQAETVVKDKNKKLYVYCRSGSRSRQAAGILKEMGHGFDAYNFTGGFRFFDAVTNDRIMIERSYPCGMDN